MEIISSLSLETTSKTPEQPSTDVEESTLCKCGRPSDKSTARKLIVCIDGTSNKFGKKNSNVVEFYSHIDKSPEANQLTYYNSGIGTYVAPRLTRLYSFVKLWLDNHIDQAIAWNFEVIILAAYRWLSDQFKPGDQIFLFGFSRGAYQVRALAAMIETVGLIYAGNQEQIPFAYQRFADLRAGWFRRRHDKIQISLFKNDREATRVALAREFKRMFSRRDVRVHFVGAWDTVSSVGFLRGNLLNLTHTAEHICFFRHALALDERRVKFVPEYVTVKREPDDHSDNHRPQSSILPAVKEVWFAGSHTDIGGGSSANKRHGRRTPSLMWIRYEARLAGLRLLRLEPGHLDEPAKPPKAPLPLDRSGEALDDGFKPTKSLGFGWAPVEILPFLNWKSYTGPELTGNSQLPHLGQGRIIFHKHKIHISIRNTVNGYIPKARYKEDDHRSWSGLLHEKNSPTWLEKLPPSYQLETAFFDEVVIESFVSQLEGDNPTEPLRDLLHCANMQDTRVILGVKNVIPILCRLPMSKDLYQLLGKLSERPLDSLQKDGASYGDALAKTAATVDEKTRRQILEVHRHMLHSGYLVCGAKGLSHLAKRGDMQHTLLKLNDILSFVNGLQNGTPEDISACLDALARLIVFDDFQKAFQHPKVIPAVMGLFKRKDTETILGAARTLCVLAKQDIFRVLINKSNPISYLVDGLIGDDRDIYENALNYLAGSDGQQPVLNADTISLAVESLKAKSFDAILGAARALRILVEYDHFCPVILRATPLPYLMAGLGCDSRKVQSACGNVLSGLARHENFRQAILDANVIASAVKMLKSGNLGNMFGGVSALYFLADHNELRAEILSESIMTYLVEGLSYNSRSVRGVCEDALCDLATYKECRKAIQEAQVTSAIMDLLKSEDSPKIVSGAGILSVLVDYDEFRAEILEKEAVWSLIAGRCRVVSESSVHDACENALDSMEQYEESRKVIADAMSLAMTWVESPDTVMVRRGLSVLSGLRSYVKLGADTLEKPLIPFLSAGLDHAESSVSKAYGSALYSLAQRGEFRKAIADAISSVATLPTSADVPRGARAIRVLAEFDNFRAQILAQNPIPSLIVGLGRESEPDQEACEEALYSLTEYPDGRKAVLDAEVISTVIEMLKTGKASTILGAAHALHILIEYDEFWAVILRENPLPYLVAGLRCDSEPAQSACGKVLFTLTKHKECRQAILDAKVISSAVKLLKSGKTRDMFGGAEALYYLGEDDELRPRILKAKPLSSLVAGLGCNSDSTQRACEKALIDVARRAEGRKAIQQARVIPKLVKMLKSTEHHKRTASARALSRLAGFETIPDMVGQTDAVALLTKLAEDPNSGPGDMEKYAMEVTSQLRKRAAVHPSANMRTRRSLLRGRWLNSLWTCQR